MSAGPVTLETLATAERFERQLVLMREHWSSVRHLWLGDPDLPAASKLRTDLPPGFWIGAGMLGLADVKPTRDGRFEFTEAGRVAVIVPCYDTIPGMLDANPERHVEHLFDLVAVDVDQAGRFWRRRGAPAEAGSTTKARRTQKDKKSGSVHPGAKQGGDG